VNKEMQVIFNIVNNIDYGYIGEKKTKKNYISGKNYRIK